MDFFFDNGIELKRRKIVDDLNVTENLFGCGQSLRFSIFFQNEWKARENDAFEAKVWNETFGSRRVADVAIWKCNSPDEWNRWPRFPLARSRRPLADQKEPVLVYLYANEPYTPGGKNTPFLATQKGPSRLQVGGSFPVGSFFSTWTHLSGSFSVFFFSPPFLTWSLLSPVSWLIGTSLVLTASFYGNFNLKKCWLSLVNLWTTWRALNSIGWNLIVWLFVSWMIDLVLSDEWNFNLRKCWLSSVKLWTT